MPRVPFTKMMQDAERRGYAVGYFESWDLESLLAVADAAEAARSPVILGFSGIALPHPDRVHPEHLEDYAALQNPQSKAAGFAGCGKTHGNCHSEEPAGDEESVVA